MEWWMDGSMDGWMDRSYIQNSRIIVGWISWISLNDSEIQCFMPRPWQIWSEARSERKKKKRAQQELQAWEVGWIYWGRSRKRYIYDMTVNTCIYIYIYTHTIFDIHIHIIYIYIHSYINNIYIVILIRYIYMYIFSVHIYIYVCIHFSI